MTAQTFLITYKKQKSKLEIDQTSVSFSGTTIPFSEIQSQFVNIVKQGGRILHKLTCNTKTYTLEYNSMSDRQIVQDRIAIELGRTPAAVKSSQEYGGVSDALLIKAKTSILGSDSMLLSMHRELVQGGLLTEDEFWSTRKDVLSNELFNQQQVKGASSVSLHSLLPDANGEGSLTSTRLRYQIHIKSTNHTCNLSAVSSCVQIVQASCS